MELGSFFVENLWTILFQYYMIMARKTELSTHFHFIPSWHGITKYNSINIKLYRLCICNPNSLVHILNRNLHIPRIYLILYWMKYTRTLNLPNLFFWAEFTNLGWNLQSSIFSSFDEFYWCTSVIQNGNFPVKQ